MFSTFASASEHEKLTVVSLGDSITFGYNLEQPQNPPKQSQNAFPFLIGTGGIEVLNVSFPGWTSTHLVQALNTIEAGTKLQQADVITLYIGANDLMQAVGLEEILASTQPIVPTEEMINKVNTAATQLSVNLQESFKLIRTKTDAPIMLYSIYNPFGQSTDPFAASLYNIGELITTKVNTEIISQIASHTGSIYLDAYTAFTGNQVNYIIQGDIHPTKAGHEALALLVTKELPSLQPPKEMTIDKSFLSTKEETSGPSLSYFLKIRILSNLNGYQEQNHCRFCYSRD
jgi:lysophospholipase L1-like esterase